MGGKYWPLSYSGLDTQEKLQIALDAMLGVKEALGRGFHAFRGIREAYQYISGDEDVKLVDRGGFYQTSQAIGTSDFPNMLLDSLTKKLIQDYADVGLAGFEKLFTKASFTDFRTQKRARLGYLGDLPTVAEAGPYTELTKPTDELVSYSPSKYGGILTISEETVRNDDLGKIRDFPGRMARAGIRTLKQYITDFYVNNPNFDPDSVAWFHATHSNLGSAALSSAELDARSIALGKQTEKDSNKRLGLPLEWIMVPVDLAPTARLINRNQSGTNSWYGKFGTNDEGIIVNELLSDANDWYFGTMPSRAPFLEIGFLDGIDRPRIFLSSEPTQGTQFSNDQLGYKVQFVFGGDIVDFRGVGKNGVV